jgi:hypothetical protein
MAMSAFSKMRRRAVQVSEAFVTVREEVGIL